jgi:hypothetical protein
MSDDIDREAFRDFERQAHNRLASTYHAFFAPVTEHAAGPLLRRADVGARTRVLDAACGSGVVARRAAQVGAIAASRRLPAGSSSFRRSSSITAMRRCPSSWSRPSARRRSPAWRRASR